MIITQILKVLLGLFLLIIGLIGLIVPIMPGWLFVFPGFALIYPEKGRMIATRLRKQVEKISNYFQ